MKILILALLLLGLATRVSAQLVLPGLFPDDEENAETGLTVPGPDRHGGLHEREGAEPVEPAEETSGELDAEARRIMQQMNARMGMHLRPQRPARRDEAPAPQVLEEVLKPSHVLRLTLVETGGKREILAPSQTLRIKTEAGYMPLGLHAVRLIRFEPGSGCVAKFRDGDLLQGELNSTLWVSGDNGGVVRLDLSAVRELRVEPEG